MNTATSSIAWGRTLDITRPLRRIAYSVLRWVLGWSEALSEARAEMRLWHAARGDHRLFTELVQASQRDLDDEASDATWGRFPERLADGRGAASHLRHL